MGKVKQKRTPQWLVALKYLFVHSKRGEPVINGALGNDVQCIGYHLRNHLCESGKIEANGIKINRVRAEGKPYKLYSIKPESMPLAESILIEYGLIKG